MSLAKWLAKAKAAGKDLALEHPAVAGGIGSGLGFFAAMNGAQAVKKALKRKEK